MKMKKLLVLLGIIAVMIGGVAWATSYNRSLNVGDTVTVTCHGTKLSVEVLSVSQVRNVCGNAPPTTTTSTTTSTTTTTPTTTTVPATTTTVPTTTTTTQPSGTSTFPDASTTGPRIPLTAKVPSQKTSGSGWHYDTRGWVSIDGANAQVSGLEFDVEVSIDASGVSLSDCVIAVSHAQFPIAVRHADNVTVDHCRVSSPGGMSIGSTNLVGIKQIYGDEDNTTFTNNEVADASTGIQMDSGVVQGNYVHDIGLYDSGSHLNGFTSNGGSKSVVVRHNTILVNAGQTDAVSFFQDFGIQANKTVDDNLLGGGGYTIYGGEGSNGPTHDIRITNNRISTLYYPNGGYWGWLAHFTSTDPGNVASGNVWDATGKSTSSPCGCP